MIDLKGKVAVVFGLANKRSIAWGIAQKLSEAGATLAICYQNERLKKEADALIPERMHSIRPRPSLTRRPPSPTFGGRRDYDRGGAACLMHTGWPLPG